MSKRTPISDRIAAQVADILQAQGQALVEARRPHFDVAEANDALAPDYRVEERFGQLRLIRVDIDRGVEILQPTTPLAFVIRLAEIHGRGIRMGEGREWDRHRDAATAAGLKGPLVKPPGYVAPKSRARKAPEAEAPAAGPSL